MSLLLDRYESALASAPLSFFEYYPKSSCHLLNCQFESQWPPNLKKDATLLLPFSHPLEKVFGLLGLWHLPEGQKIFLPEDSLGSITSHLNTLRSEILLKSCVQSPDKSSPLYFWGLSPGALEWLRLQAPHDCKTSPVNLGEHTSLKISQKVHDKRFIEKLQGSLLATLIPQSEFENGWISSFEELKKAAQFLAKIEFSGALLLKKAWAAAGRGHILIKSLRELLQISSSLEKRLKTLFEEEGGFILQPYLSRVLDFSSLWYIDPSGKLHFFAMTRMDTNQQGHYKGCTLATLRTLFSNHLPFIEEHLEQAQKVLAKVIEEGYFGPIGLDALIYQTSLDNKNRDYKSRIIEINARSTLAMHLVSIMKKQAIEKGLDPLTLSHAKLIKFNQSTSLPLLLPPSKSHFNIAVTQGTF